MTDSKTVVAGAGPAGMACAYELARAGQKPVLVEQEEVPGGLCRTLSFNGYLFDIGGHRFLSPSREIRELWEKVMGLDLLRVKRISRIYFKKKFFNYPLSFLNTLIHLGPYESVRSILSYLHARIFRDQSDDTFEGWVTNRFGRRLYEIFFKTYTEKVWALSGCHLSADWASQRIGQLSLRVALKNAFFDSIGKPKTLARDFFYPQTGPGDFYRRFCRQAEDLGTEFRAQIRLNEVRLDAGRVEAAVLEDCRTGKQEAVKTGHLFSTVPLPELIGMIRPVPDEEILKAAGRLQFRSFITVNVILNRPHLFPDQWLYIHDPEVRMGRIQNYKNWSTSMVPETGRTSLGLEYFCHFNDSFWNQKDSEIIDFALKELEKIMSVPRQDFVSGFVVRVRHAYPIYTLSYRKDLAILRAFLETVPNLTSFGRQGLFRYDNSDHALLTGFYAARNYLGKGNFPIWDFPNEGYLEG